MLLGLILALVGIIALYIYHVKKEFENFKDIDHDIERLRQYNYETAKDLGKHIHCLECGKTIIPDEYRICIECLRKKGIESLDSDLKYLNKEIKIKNE